MSPRNTIEVIPSARRLVEALRDVGYDFPGAVADLIDNSIAAKATEVAVDIVFDGPDSWVRIADNGEGMDASTIDEALRFGSERTYRTDDLGKFGLGLKTASLSQCRCLSVASRRNPAQARMEARRFDLDLVLSNDRWEIEMIPAVERDPELVEPLRASPGTVVIWDKLDRALGYKVPWGDRARHGLFDLAERTEQHLAMVFHRFLTGEVPQGRRLTISVNGNKVRPWDPFARDEARTERLTPYECDIVANGASGIVRFEPYVLPRRDQFSSEKEFDRLTGPSKWNQQQGFYAYRANRMIQSGGWSRMRTAEEHTKLARAALDFYPDLDSAFGINIAKMRVVLPSQLRDRLRQPVDELARRADKVYRTKEAGTLYPGAAPTPRAGSKRAPKADRRSGDPLHPVSSLDHTPAGRTPLVAPTLEPVRGALERAAARAGEADALDRIIAQLREAFPEIARDLGW
jgi:hypothetical protein